MHLSPPTQDDLEHGVASRRVGVGGGLTRRPEGDAESEHKNSVMFAQELNFIELLISVLLLFLQYFLLPPVFTCSCFLLQ